MISPLSLCYYVSMSVGKYVFSKAAHKSSETSREVGVLQG